MSDAAANRLKLNRCCLKAAACGDLTLLKSFPTDCLYLNVAMAAALNGHVHCLQYVHENGPDIWDNPRICLEAIMGGHLDCLRYAHETGCRWDESTSIAISQNGSVDCLRYAVSHGCPYDRNRAPSVRLACCAHAMGNTKAGLVAAKFTANNRLIYYINPSFSLGE